MFIRFRFFFPSCDLATLLQLERRFYHQARLSGYGFSVFERANALISGSNSLGRPFDDQIGLFFFFFENLPLFGFWHLTNKRCYRVKVKV